MEIKFPNQFYRLVLNILPLKKKTQYFLLFIQDYFIDLPSPVGQKRK